VPPSARAGGSTPPQGGGGRPGLVTLYDAPSCWKCAEVKEALDALGLEYEAVTVRGDPAARAALVAAQGEPPQVPMLVDGRLAVWDRRRILAYLAQTYGGETGGTPYREMPSYAGGVCAVDAGEACA
jgi:glutathione S-transferase